MPFSIDFPQDQNNTTQKYKIFSLEMMNRVVDVLDV